MWTHHHLHSHLTMLSSVIPENLSFSVILESRPVHFLNKIDLEYILYLFIFLF